MTIPWGGGRTADRRRYPEFRKVGESLSSSRRERVEQQQQQQLLLLRRRAARRRRTLCTGRSRSRRSGTRRSSDYSSHQPTEHQRAAGYRLVIVSAKTAHDCLSMSSCRRGPLPPLRRGRARLDPRPLNVAEFYVFMIFSTQLLVSFTFFLG